MTDREKKLIMISNLLLLALEAVSEEVKDPEVKKEISNTVQIARGKLAEFVKPL